MQPSRLTAAARALRVKHFHKSAPWAKAQVLLVPISSWKGLFYWIPSNSSWTHMAWLGVSWFRDSNLLGLAEVQPLGTYTSKWPNIGCPRRCKLAGSDLGAKALSCCCKSDADWQVPDCWMPLVYYFRCGVNMFWCSRFGHQLLTVSKS